MLNKSELIQALSDGDVQTLTEANEIDPSLAADDDVVSAASRAAKNVVWHRPDYRATLARACALGVKCDLWTVARAGLVDEVKRLLADDESLLNASNKQGRTALQEAALVYGACKECEEVVDLLLEQGAHVDVFTAATFCIPDAVKSEIERDPKVVAERCQGSTALNWAVRPRRNQDSAPEICRLLLTAGADVHDRDEYESGMTPLHHAAEWGPKVCLEIVDLLLDSGADLNEKDDQGWTALDYAQDRNRAEMIQHLTKLGAVSAR